MPLPACARRRRCDRRALRTDLRENELELVEQPRIQRDVLWPHGRLRVVRDEVAELEMRAHLAATRRSRRTSRNPAGWSCWVKPLGEVGADVIAVQHSAHFLAERHEHGQRGLGDDLAFDAAHDARGDRSQALSARRTTRPASGRGSSATWSPAPRDPLVRQRGRVAADFEREIRPRRREGRNGPGRRGCHRTRRATAPR